MKLKFLTLISIILIISCGDNLIEEVKERYDDGKLKIVNYYKKVGDNQELVKISRYYENGQIEKEENFKDGNKDGKWTWYYENGQIEQEENWKDDKEDGKWIRYYKDGQIVKEGNFKDGNRDGKLIYYNDDGSKQKEETYKDGKLVQ